MRAISYRTKENLVGNLSHQSVLALERVLLPTCRMGDIDGVFNISNVMTLLLVEMG